MEFQETVLPEKQAKSQAVKAKHKMRTTQPPKSNDKEQPFVHKRVFGSVRNPNLEEKSILEKPKWKTPSLKPAPVTAPSKEPVYKPAPKPKLVREEPITKITQKKIEPVQITPSPQDVSQKTTHNSKHCPKEPISDPSHKLIKPERTPPAKEIHQKTAPNSKSVPNKTTKTSSKSARPVQTLKPVPIELIIVPVQTTPAIRKASTKPKMVTNKIITVPSQKPDQPVQATVPAQEGIQKIDVEDKIIPKKPTIAPSPKPTQPVQTTPLALELPLEIAPNPKPVQNEPISKQVKKNTTHQKLVQDKPIFEISPKTGQLQVPEMPKKTASIKKPKKKKSVSFPEGGSADLKTPGLAKAKPRVSGTPYYTAKRCGKCRFDKMERSSYWLGLIKVAENVEKHTLSAGFFNLALEAKPEPISALKVELKRYMSRHGYLSADREWENLTASYGLKITPNDHVEVQASENDSDRDQEHDDSTEQNAKQLENN